MKRKKYLILMQFLSLSPWKSIHVFFIDDRKKNREKVTSVTILFQKKWREFDTCRERVKMKAQVSTINDMDYSNLKQKRVSFFWHTNVVCFAFSVITSPLVFNLYRAMICIREALTVCHFRLKPLQMIFWEIRAAVCNNGSFCMNLYTVCSGMCPWE